MMRVLHILGSLDVGGAETVIMDYYRNIDRSKIQFDFLLANDGVSYYEEEAVSLGARIFKRPLRSKRPFKNCYEFSRVLKKNKDIDIIHIHHNSSIASIDCTIARLKGVKIRIVHSHSTSALNMERHKWLLPLLRKNTTHHFCCSIDAGIAMFGEGYEHKLTFVPNARNLSVFKYNLQRRNEMRNELNIGDKYAIINVGRLIEQKNHTFLLDVLYDALKIQKDIVLLIVGEGKLRDELIAKAKSLGIYDSVQFLGLRSDVADILQASDIYVAPSLVEGLNMAAIEAQATGLPTLLSDVHPKESQVTGNVEYLSINGERDAWVNGILAYQNHERHDTHSDNRIFKYDILEASKCLEVLYFDIIDKKIDLRMET